jgi:hypothetical protein
MEMINKGETKMVMQIIKGKDHNAEFNIYNRDRYIQIDTIVDGELSNTSTYPKRLIKRLNEALDFYGLY